MLGDPRAALVEFVHPSDSPYPQEVHLALPLDSPYPQEAHLALPLDSPCPLPADLALPLDSPCSLPADLALPLDSLCPLPAELALPLVFHYPLGDLAADFPGHCIQVFRFPEVQAPFPFTGGGVLGLAPAGRAVCQVLSKEVEAA